MAIACIGERECERGGTFGRGRRCAGGETEEKQGEAEVRWGRASWDFIDGRRRVEYNFVNKTELL